MTKSLSLFLLGGLFLVSCGTKKLGSVSRGFSSDDASAIQNEIKQNIFQHQSIKYTSSAKIRLNGTTYNANLQVRMERDKALWISATATIIGVEVGRLLLTADSVFLINYLERTYLSEPISFFATYLAVEPSLNQIQDIMLGNSITDFQNANIQVSKDSIHFISALGLFSLVESFSKKQLKPHLLKVSNQKQNTLASIVYDNFEKIGNNALAKQLTIQTENEKQPINAVLNNANFVLNETLSFPFKIPGSYKKM